ncbi:MAG: hypothetical protein ABIH34_04910 [Nanoarchaeota archaeon]
MKRGQFEIALFVSFGIITLIFFVFFFFLNAESNHRGERIKDTFGDLDSNGQAIILFQQEFRGESLAVHLAREYDGQKDYGEASRFINGVLESMFSKPVCWRITIEGTDSVEEEGSCLGKRLDADILLPRMYRKELRPLRVEVEIW